MFSEKEQPIAWRPFIEGEYPVKYDKKEKVYNYPKGKGPDYPREIFNPIE